MSQFLQLKSQADQEDAAMRQCFQISQDAHANRDYGMANSYSEQGHIHRANRDALRAQLAALRQSKKQRNNNPTNSSQRSKTNGKRSKQTIQTKARQNYAENDIFAKRVFTNDIKNGILFVVQSLSKIITRLRRLQRTVVPETPVVFPDAAEEVLLVQTEAERISERYDEIAIHGHAVQRHGEHITEQQIDARVIFGEDPITGTTNDAFRKDAFGNPLPHKYSKNATKFTSKDALVKAEEYVKNSQVYKDDVDTVNLTGGNRIVIQNIKLEDVFGVAYKDQVFGKTRLGSKNNPIGVVETDFTDGTLRAVFIKNANDEWCLETMFPDPVN
jgi:hypothetical protein